MTAAINTCTPVFISLFNLHKTKARLPPGIKKAVTLLVTALCYTGKCSDELFAVSILVNYS